MCASLHLQLVELIARGWGHLDYQRWSMSQPLAYWVDFCWQKQLNPPHFEGREPTKKRFQNITCLG